MEYAFIDIETIPREGAEPPPFDPGRLKDPVKVAEAEANYREGLTKKMSLDSDLCRIVSAAVVCIRDNGQEISRDVWLAKTDDRKLLQEVAHRLSLARTTNAATIVGWNCKNFDLPVLWKRGVMQGVPVLPWGVYMDFTSKYRQEKCIDLMHVWAAYEWAKLAECAATLGVPAKTGMDGSEIYAAYKAKEWDRITTYNLEDCDAMIGIARKFGIITDIVEKNDEPI